MPAEVDGQKIKQLEWGRLIGSIPSSYTVLKIGSTVYAECNVYGGTDYSDIAGTKDATTIQSAINALTAGRTAPEKVTLKGNFTVESTISVPGYTILDMTAAKLTAKNSLNDEMIDTTGYDFALLGGYLDGNKANQTSGIPIKILGDSQRFWVKDQWIKNAKDYGLYAVGTSGHEVGVGVFDGINVESSSSHGIYFGAFTNDHIITNCNSGGNTGNGFLFSSSGASLIDTCLAWNNELLGFDNYASNAQTFLNIRSDWNYYQGFRINGSERCILNGASIYNNGGDSPNTVDGVLVYDSTYCTVANVLSGNIGVAYQRYGVNVAGTSDYCQIKGNSCYTNVTAPYSVLGSHNSYDGIARTAVSADLSGSATTLIALHAEQACHLARAILLYTEASSSNTGITVEIGKETDRNYYYEGTTETDKSQWYTKEVTLLKNDIAAGDTVTFYSPAGKTGTGEIMLILEYLTGAN